MADQAATGARTRTERTRRAAARPSPSAASGLRSVPRAPTLQPQPATRPAHEQATAHTRTRDRSSARPPGPQRHASPGEPISWPGLAPTNRRRARPRLRRGAALRGRAGSRHASLPIRRNTRRIWPPAQHSPNPATRAASPAGRPRRSDPRDTCSGPRHAPAATARRAPRGSASDAANARHDDRVGASEEAHHDPRTRAPRHARAPHHRASESTPSPAPPRPPSPPLLMPLSARPPDCSSDSLPHAPRAPGRPR